MDLQHGHVKSDGGPLIPYQSRAGIYRLCSWSEIDTNRHRLTTIGEVVITTPLCCGPTSSIDAFQVRASCNSDIYRACTQEPAHGIAEFARCQRLRNSPQSRAAGNKRNGTDASRDRANICGRLIRVRFTDIFLAVVLAAITGGCTTSSPPVGVIDGERRRSNLSELVSEVASDVRDAADSLLSQLGLERAGDDAAKPAPITPPVPTRMPRRNRAAVGRTGTGSRATGRQPIAGDRRAGRH